MSSSALPERPSLEYLRKLAKDRQRELRRTDPEARLADAQLAVAREYGFSSWRALKAEVDRRNAATPEAFLAACAAGDVVALRNLLDNEPGLVHARDPEGATPLHRALPHPAAVRLLLEHGADPNARDVGDNALPLHFAAGGAPLETVRALLDAGSDVHGAGDAHGFDVIGWATCFADARRDVVELLLEGGARHNAFSAIAVGDLDALRDVVAEDPRALERRLSGSGQEQTPLHYLVAPPDGLVGGTFRTGEHYRTLELLIELGAELEAVDAKGRTPLALAMLRGDREAMRILHAAGAREPESDETEPADALAELGASAGGITPMLAVPDMEATVAWYRAIGFELTGSHGEEGKLDWAAVKFGKAEIMFVPSGDPWRDRTSGLNLWIRADRLDDLYAALKRLQLKRARAALAGGPADVSDVRFRQDLYTAFYGQREFCIEDPNGVALNFFRELE